MHIFYFPNNQKVIRSFQRITFFYLLIILSGLSIKAQKYYFDNYGVKEGLAQSKVYCVLQDKQGNVWLGTPSGVSVFNGQNFTNYSVLDNLAKGGVKSIYQDSRGIIWLGHLDGGVTKTNGKKFSEISFPFDLKSDITSIIEDAQHNIWLTTHGNGAIIIYKTNKEILDSADIKIFKGRSLSDRVFSSYRDRNNKLYFITDIGIKTYNKTDTTFENLLLKGFPTYFQIICMYQDTKNNFWFGTFNGGLYKYSIEYKKITIYDEVKHGLAKNWITCVTEDKLGNIWAGSWGGGISKIDENKIQTFNTVNGLHDNNIYSVIGDYEGNVLIGTLEHGLEIYKGEYFISISEDDGLIDNQVSAIHQDKYGRFWFGTSSGISIYNPANKTFQNISSNDKSLRSKKIRFIKQDSQNTIWVGTEDLGVLRYDEKFNAFFPVREINLWNRLQRVTAMDVDKYDNLWVGTVDGLIFYEIKSGKSERYSQVEGLAGPSISSIFCGNNGIVWVGSEGKGVTTINLIDSSINIIAELGQISPRSFTEDNDDHIWIGTEQGAIIFNGKKVIYKYNEINGLLANFISFIDIDNNSNIYIGTNLGLNKIDHKNNKLYSFTKKNGFIGIEAKQNASFKDNEGKMWFGTVDGVMRYDPDLMQKPFVEPKIYLKTFKVNLQDRAIISGTKLKHNEKPIYLEYSSVCLSNPDAVKYQIMLKGVDNDYQSPTNQTSVIYRILPPGNYVLYIKAKNHLGIWNSEPLAFEFTIKPPFYKTAWFIISVIILGFTIIITYIKIRERNLIREKRILEEKVKERTQEIRIKNQELAKKNKDITDSIKYAKRIQDAILPEDAFENTFILFRPKDIVSGDFFWFAKKDNKEIIAAVDCTGHGVPGAFVSFVGHNSLNKIIKEYGIIKPADILNRLDLEVVKT
ncbi:MAG: hypothetical protein JXB17_06040, partial [Bacteroidales bacterium]|nr:hypothetical protein [Bacteroidales bacterium]